MLQAILKSLTAQPQQISRQNYHRRLACEPLEVRAMLTPLTWDGGAEDGVFKSPDNWDPNNVPDASDDITFNTDTGTITIDAA